MAYSVTVYGPAVEAFLTRASTAAALGAMSDPAAVLFPTAPYPREALAGLWLKLGDLTRSHAISQDLSSSEAAFWHGIMHRREPDASNAAYWFRRLGRHAVFPAVREAAIGVGYEAARRSPEWDPFAWIEFWDRVRRQPYSPEGCIGAEVQRVEWEILFDHCARPLEKK